MAKHKYRILEQINAKTGEKEFYPQYESGGSYTAWHYIYDDDDSPAVCHTSYDAARTELHNYHVARTSKPIIHEVTFK